MTGTLNALLAAVVLFVGGHFLLSGLVLRKALVRRLGDALFRVVYSLVIGAGFVWLLFAYQDAPYLELWPPMPALAWIPILVMPVALFLAVCGMTTRSATMVGGEKVLAEDPGDPAPGIMRVTRHPFLWGATLWAAAHLVVNGDAASLLLTGGILVLTLGGMWHIDRRREATLGSDWGPIKLTTSAIPFAAIVQGRASFDWQGIGLWRTAIALALYVALLHFHGAIFGVSALPG